LEFPPQQPTSSLSLDWFPRSALMLLNHLLEDWADIFWVPHYVQQARTGRSPNTDSDRDDWTRAADVIAFLISAGLVEVGTLDHLDHDAFVPVASERLETARTLQAFMHSMAETSPSDRDPYAYFVRNTRIGEEAAQASLALVRGWWLELG
jgi:hypothetical protein